MLHTDLEEWYTEVAGGVGWFMRNGTGPNYTERRIREAPSGKGEEKGGDEHPPKNAGGGSRAEGDGREKREGRRDVAVDGKITRRTNRNTGGGGNVTARARGSAKVGS